MLFPSPIFSFINLWKKITFLAYLPPFSPKLLWLFSLSSHNAIGLKKATIVSL